MVTRSRLYLAVTADRNGQRTTIRLRGELDVSSRDELRAVIDRLLEARPQLIVVDVSGLTFIESTSAVFHLGEDGHHATRIRNR